MLWAIAANRYQMPFNRDFAAADDVVGVLVYVSTCYFALPTVRYPSVCSVLWLRIHMTHISNAVFFRTPKIEFTHRFLILTYCTLTYSFESPPKDTLFDYYNHTVVLCIRILSVWKETALNFKITFDQF